MATASNSRGQGYQVTGVRETVRGLERLGVGTQDLKDAFRKVSGVVVKRAVRNVTARAKNPSGEVAGTIRPGNTKNKAVVRAGYARQGAHAGIDNYGGRVGVRVGKRKAWLNDAANENTEQHVQTVVSELDRLARRVGLT